MTWKAGRQKGAYYHVMTFLSFWRVDLHLIRIPKNVEIPWHCDEVNNKRHYRLNYHFGNNKPQRFQTELPFSSWLQGKLIFFRPDINKHKLMESKYHTTYILSFGFVL